MGRRGCVKSAFYAAERGEKIQFVTDETFGKGEGWHPRHFQPSFVAKDPQKSWISRARQLKNRKKTNGRMTRRKEWREFSMKREAASKGDCRFVPRGDTSKRWDDNVTYSAGVEVFSGLKVSQKCSN